MSDAGQPSTEIIDRRYMLLDVLGEGGMGLVYKARDKLTGQQIALKRITSRADDLQFTSRSIGGGATNYRLNLAQEFQTLASLRHPNIISVLDYGFDEARQPYFTMDLLENAQTIVEAGRQQPSLAAQVTLVGQMLQAIDYLHRRNILHRDLKPRNVLVVGGHVKVVDFGLAVSVDQASGPVGTFGYIAPEVLRGENATKASDFHAVGLIFYELLTGKRLFDADTFSAMMDKILRTPPDLTLVADDPARRPVVPILERLLAKDPSVRYENVPQIIEALGQAAAVSLPLETEDTRESYLQAVQIIGRDPELARLHLALDRIVGHTAGGQGEAWLVGGESGVGKSRLLREIATSAMIRGAVVLRGQGVQGGRLAYQLWRDPVSRLALTTDLTDDEASVLLPVAPDIGKLFERPIPAPLDAHGPRGQERLISGIVGLFRRQQQPMVLILEDLQWADESLVVLNRLTDLSADLPLLILGSFRDDERPALPAAVPGMQLLHLDRLPRDQMVELAASMIGPAGRLPDVADLLERETEGNVFFLIEVVRALAISAGRLDEIGTQPLPRSVLTGGVQRIVQMRLGRVPAEARPVVWLAAVLGRRLDLKLLEAVYSPADIDRWLYAAADAAVLEVSDNRWQFAHDKLREAVIDGLATDECQRLHRLAAETIVKVYGDEAEQAATLAYHWGQAGDTVQESRYARIAGKTALETCAYITALGFLSRSAELSQDTHDLAVVYQLIGEAHDNLGNYAEAETFFTRSLDVAHTLNDQNLIADNELGMGVIALNRGVYPDAERLLTASRDRCAANGNQVGKAEALLNLGVCFAYQGQFERSISCWQEGYEIDLGKGNRRGQAANLGNIGAAYDYLGYSEKALDHFQRALPMRREVADRRGEANDLGNIGNTYCNIGNFEEAIPYYDQAITIRRDIGDRRGEGNDTSNLGSLHLILGHIEQARVCIERSLAINLSIGDKHGEALAHDNMSNMLAMQGRYTEALHQSEKALALVETIGNPRSEAMIRYHQGLCLMRMSATQPLTQLQKAFEIADQIQSGEFIGPILSGLALLALHNGDLPLALQHSQKACEHVAAENAAEQWVLRGIILLRAGQSSASAFQTAVQEADRVLAKSPGSVAPLFSRALALTGLRSSEASAAYMAALEHCQAPGVIRDNADLLKELRQGLEGLPHPPTPSL